MELIRTNISILNAEESFKDQITNNYCNLIKHVIENKWTLIYDVNYDRFFTTEEKNGLQVLTSDWFPASTMP